MAGCIHKLGLGTTRRGGPAACAGHRRDERWSGRVAQRHEAAPCGFDCRLADVAEKWSPCAIPVERRSKLRGARTEQLLVAARLSRPGGTAGLPDQVRVQTPLNTPLSGMNNIHCGAS